MGSDYPPPPHLLLFPYPAQGHVMPLMELAQTLAIHGLNITFLNTQTNHNRLIASTILENGTSSLSHRIRMVSLPDLADNEYHMDQLRQPMLEKLVSELNEKDDDHGRITCFLADYCAAWSLEVGKKMGIKTAVFVPFSATTLLLISNIQNLIDDGTIDQEGVPLRKDANIEFSPLLPHINTKDFTWVRSNSVEIKRVLFDLVKSGMEKEKLSQWTIINTTQSLESAALSLVPQARPIGPLISVNRQAGNLWLEDLECLKWLDQQSTNSVIYAAFGSTTFFSHDQFLNLASGLELTNRPFLWVIRPDSVNGAELEYIERVLDRVGTMGKVVKWAPQEKVLGHPSVACFFTHCGWNSTIEGISNGLPLLCWPYIGDQFMDKNYICYVWRVGLGFERKDEEVISKEEIRDKIETLISDKSFKARALELKDSTLSCVKENGSSYKNLLDFIEWVRN
ncbi:UDP-glycosyltransferase 83A1-like [Impatiens glandulifera]|uniref:UDP-glycosyltransferase 83A1-like n=1 Tax=Impatiens glandulifera TaxID=253017 RepID=UPI001FB0F7C6|nr:UDP-glycosyltransferase 83A1-like [Impatiens glandulifera]